MRPSLRSSLALTLSVASMSSAAAQSQAPILVQGAMQLEVRRLLDSVHVTRVDSIGPWAFAHGTLEGMPIIVSRTLMGNSNAAAATALAIEHYHPRAIINEGTAGGHDSTLHNGAIVIGQSAISLAAYRSPPRAANEGLRPLEWMPLDLVQRPGDRDGDMHQGSYTQLAADSALLAAAHRARAASPALRISDGVIASADFWNQEIDRISFFHRQMHSSVEEMETAPAAQVAHAFGVPFVGIRVVSDNAITNEKFDPRTADLLQDFVVRVTREYVRGPTSVAAQGSQARRTHVVLLGTGTPNPDPDRFGPAVAIVVDTSVYLVDAGAGVVRRVAAAARETKLAAFTMPRLTRAFLTHLHSDHTVGLADLMLTPWVIGRTQPLEVYGPPGTKSMVDHLSAAYAEDIDIRLHGGEPSNKTGYVTNAHDARPGVVYQDALVKVTAFAVPHGKWPAAYGYRFDTPDRSIVISGDTSPSDAVADACHGCDLLVHEVISEAHLAGRTADWQAYHRAYHTTGPEVGRIAAKAGAKQLVLYHELPMGFDEAELLAEVRRFFTGPVAAGKDLDVY